MSNFEVGEKESLNGVRNDHLRCIRESTLIGGNTPFFLPMFESLAKDCEKKRTTTTAQQSLASLKASLNYFG